VRSSAGPDVASAASGLSRWMAQVPGRRVRSQAETRGDAGLRDWVKSWESEERRVGTVDLRFGRRLETRVLSGEVHYSTRAQQGRWQSE